MSAEARGKHVGGEERGRSRAADGGGCGKEERWRQIWMCFFSSRLCVEAELDGVVSFSFVSGVSNG